MSPRLHTPTASVQARVAAILKAAGAVRPACLQLGLSRELLIKTAAGLPMQEASLTMVEVRLAAYEARRHVA